MVDYPKVEWVQSEDQEFTAGEGYIRDTVDNVQVLPQELVARYNYLAERVTTLKVERRALIEAAKHIGVGVKAMEIVLKKGSDSGN